MKINAIYSTEEYGDTHYGGLLTPDFLFHFRYSHGQGEDFHTLEYHVEPNLADRKDYLNRFLLGQIFDLKFNFPVIELSDKEYSHLKEMAKSLAKDDEVFYRTREELTNEGLKRPLFPEEYQLFEEIEKRMQEVSGK